MKINLDKSQIIVCRNGGIVSKVEKWYLGGNEISNVSYYKYLGLSFSTRDSWSKGVLTLVDQARKSFNIVKRFLNSVRCDDINTWFKMYDVIVKPVLCYGAEIWGYRVWDCIEQFHTYVCKYILGKSTTNDMLLGELQGICF